MKNVFNIDIQEENMGSAGVICHFSALVMNSENMVLKDLEGRRLFEFSLSELSQCALPSKSEVEFQFVEEDTTKTTVSMRCCIYCRKKLLLIFVSSSHKEIMKTMKTQRPIFFNKWFWSVLA